ncbi:MAG TPA: hypothetical protein VMU24_09660 [Candidatus Acidoferrales bacterium]|nr:hypothetical protein [Candidatus Acidoferrales bacterium]
MPKFTALVYDTDDVAALERTMNCLSLASDILVLLNGSHQLEKVAHRHGARTRNRIPGVTLGAYATEGFYPWTLVMHAGDELTPESLLALHDWRKVKEDNAEIYRLQNSSSHPLVLVNRARVNWIGKDPPIPKDAPTLLPQDKQRAA